MGTREMPKVLYGDDFLLCDQRNPALTYDRYNDYISFWVLLLSPKTRQDQKLNQIFDFFFCVCSKLNLCILFTHLKAHARQKHVPKSNFNVDAKSLSQEKACYCHNGNMGYKQPQGKSCFCDNGNKDDSP